MPSTWKLIIEDDAGKQIVVPFTRDVITIGRKEGNTIRLTERNVSRNHAKLSKENGNVVVEDLKSFNGIKLNGDRIDGRVHVHEGDTIQIGDYHLALHAQEGAGAGAGGNTNGVNATQPLRRDTAPQGHAADDNDEFAGDTQRWEPPQGGPQLSVAGLATQEDRPLGSDEHTVPQPAVQRPPSPPPLNPDKNSFGADSGDTERVTMDMLDAMKQPSSLPTRRPEPELEPTVRQATSPPPITMPPAPPVQPPPQALPPEPVLPTSAMPQIGAHLGVLETKPEPRAQERLPNLPEAKPAAHKEPAHKEPAHKEPAHKEPAHKEPSHKELPSSPASPGTQSPSAAPRTPALEARTVLEEQTEAMRASPGSEDVMYPRLVVLNTIFAGSTFSLRAAEAVMGRTEDNDITIEHKSVSRNHAKVVREGDRVRILDLKSANGVLVNNEEVEQSILKPGDVVELGRVKLRYVPIGERFSVAPDEIERARIADAAGDDFESDAGTGVTNPVRKKQVSAVQSEAFETFSPPGKTNFVFIVAGVVVVLAIIAVVIVMKMLSGDDKKTELTPPPPPAPVAVLAPVAPPPPPPPVDTKAPEDAKPADVKPPDVKPDVVADAAAKPDDTPPSTTTTTTTSHKPKVDNNKAATEAVKSAKAKILQNDAGGAVAELAPFVKSDNADVHRTLGVAYAKLKNNDLARKHYKKYLELKPDAPDAAQVKAILDGTPK